MSFLAKLEWRNATKAFDPARRLSDSDRDAIFKAIHMAPSSFGLQPFYVKVVKDPQAREKLKAAGWNQGQFTSADTLMVFVARTDVGKRISELVQLVEKETPERKATLPMYEKMMRGFVEKFDERYFLSWAQRQAYIALGFAMAACAELGIDSCPIEGFDPQEFDKILGLPKGEHASVVLAVGYRDPKFVPGKKVRFRREDILR